MKIIDIAIYKGRNIYSHNPVMKMMIDIGKYKDIPTKDIKGFNEKLLNSFPNLKKNTCGLGYEGGFLERLEEGTYIGHVLEHVILDIQNTLGFDVKYGKTRELKENPSHYYLIYEYINEICALECSKLAVVILNYFIKGKDVKIDEILDYLRKIVIDTEMGPSTTAIANEAKKRNIPVNRIGYESIIRLGLGKYSKIMQATLSEATSCISADISSNKQLTKAILNDNKIPIPYGKLVYTEISTVMAANEIGMPVVIKPFDCNQGKGVTLNITSESEIKKAFKEASKYGTGIIVEKYVKGNDYRILVVGGKVKAVSQRIPAMVVGDGKHTIKELVDFINMQQNRGESHEKPLTKIKLDKITINILKKNGMNEKYIPTLGENVLLRENGNISTGGTAIDCTDIIHPDNAQFAIKAAEVIGIDIAGIDMVAEDISKSISTSSGAVIEINASPGIRMHLYPSEGKARNVAKDIVDLLFPDDKVNDFPIVSVTGTNGKTTTVRMISHVLGAIGRSVGMTTTSGTFIGEECTCKGDNSGPRSAKSLLTNKLIDAAVLETARGGIIREGLGYDLANIGIVTNITEDHLGLDGVKTIQDLAFVKALVVEAIKPDGYAVLNAEDEMTNYILQRVKTKVIVFYKDKANVKIDNLDEYINVFVDSDGMIKIKDGKNEILVLKAKDIPITNNGLIDCNIDNSLATICALYGLNVPLESIVEGLISFKDNPGRFQVFDVKNYKIMLDYAHNSAGYEQVINACQSFDKKRLVGVIGMPGDRPNTAIESVGTIAASVFDEIYIKEDAELRGRERCEVANILYDSIIKTSYDNDKVRIIENETDALNCAMENAKEGDLIVVLYEKLQPLLEMIQKEIKEEL